VRVPDEHGAVAGSWKTVLAGTSTVSELEEATLFELAQVRSGSTREATTVNRAARPRAAQGEGQACPVDRKAVLYEVSVLPPCVTDG